LQQRQDDGTATPADLAVLASMQSQGYTLAQAQATLNDPRA
jgi:hypothetical protein